MKRKRNKDDEGPHQIRSLLSSYYPTTMSLWQLLQLDDNDDADLDPLKSYLVGLQVLPHKGSDQPSRDKGLFQKCAPRAQTDDAEPEITMAQVIDAAQTHLLWSSSRPSAKDMGSKQNVLTIGCRMNHQDLPSFVVPVIGPYANNLVSKHMTIENTLNNFLIKSFAFSALLKRIGAKAMIELLASTSIFVPQGNGCYFQVCGKPLVDLNVIEAARIEKSTPQLTDVVILKSSLMYSRANRTKTGRIRMGIPIKHPLHTIHDLSPPLLDNHLKAIHLAKRIFPSSFQLKPFSHTEQDIEGLPPMKTPRRLKTLIAPSGMIFQIVQRSASDRTNEILQKFCPKKYQNQGLTEEEKLSVVELIEPSQASHIRLSSHFPTCADKDDESNRKTTSASEKPKFNHFVCSYYEVETYLWGMIHSLGLDNWWGDSLKNKNVVRENIRQIIKLRKFEKISLHQLLQNMAIKDCSCLIGSIVDTKSSAMFHDFVWWFYESFIGTLIKSTFFVTESAIFKNRTIYFRLDDWEELCMPLIRSLRTDAFTRIEPQEEPYFKGHLQLGKSSMRLLPKEIGVRPIVNFRRKIPTRGGLSNNSVLQDLFATLTYEKDIKPDLMGSSVLGLNDIYLKFKEFKDRLKSDTHERLYLVKVDVKACFDTIQQEKLLQIINGLLTEDQYVVQRYTKVMGTSVKGKVNKQFKRQAYPSDEHPNFDEFVSQVSRTLRNVIFNDQVRYPYIHKTHLLSLLREHVTENFVKIGSHTYQQKVGIPQGSILSPLLCSLFYADMDKNYLGFANREHSLLLRLMDDFLFITTAKSDAQRFLEVMKQGMPEYGCFISTQKTLTNFKYNDTKVLGSLEFPWCGHLINAKSLNFTADYGRYHGTHIGDTLTVDMTKSPGLSFRQRMFQAVRVRMSMIYLDTKLNSAETVRLNLYQALLLVATKYVAYLNDWKADVIKSYKFFHDVIERTIGFLCISVQRQTEQKYVIDAGGMCSIKAFEITWLGRQAFSYILSRRSQKFRLVLRLLKIDLEKQSKRCFTRRTAHNLQKILGSKSNRIFKGIKY